MHVIRRRGSRDRTSVDQPDGPSEFVGWGEVAFPPEVVASMRRTRRRPRRTQFDYLHVRRLADDLAAVLARVGADSTDVLDLYCGTRPYDDLLPPGAAITGFDLPGNPYGVADVVSDEFLPFADAAFDLVMCIEAFHYVADPARGVDEIGRVLRPGGHAVVAVPLVWDYDRTQLEHRFTGPELEALFDGWDEVSVIENGGRGVAWSTLTGSIANMIEWHVPYRLGARRVVKPLFASFYLVVNAIGAAVDRAERRYARSSLVLPMNLLLTAKRPDRVPGS